MKEFNKPESRVAGWERRVKSERRLNETELREDEAAVILTSNFAISVVIFVR